MTQNDNNSDSYFVFVKDQQTMIFKVNDRTTPHDLIVKVSERLNIPNTKITLVNRGKPYYYSDTISFGEYNIQSQTTFFINYVFKHT